VRCLSREDAPEGAWSPVFDDERLYYLVRTEDSERPSLATARVVARDPRGKLTWEVEEVRARRAVTAGRSLILEGPTRAKDNRLLFLDAETGNPRACFPLPDEVAHWAADETRVYVATKGGLLMAAVLPAPGNRAPEARTVEPSPSAIRGEPPSSPSWLDEKWTLARTFKAHPARAWSTGKMYEGAIWDAVFVSETEVAIGGSDNRVSVYDVTKGKLVWKSNKIEKDVIAVAACPKATLAATGYEAGISLFERRDSRWTPWRVHMDHDTWGLLGLTDDCNRLLLANTGKITALDVSSSAELFSVEVERGPRFADSGTRLRNDLLAVPKGDTMSIFDVSKGDAEPALVDSVPVVWEAHGGRLVHAWMADSKTLAITYCSVDACMIELTPLDRGTPRVLTVDMLATRTSAIVPTWELSRDVSEIVFHALELQPIAMHLATGETTLLTTLAGPLRHTGAVTFAYSQSGRFLVLAGHPRAFDLSVLESSAKPGADVQPGPGSRPARGSHEE
jgi:hypothetical protein